MTLFGPDNDTPPTRDTAAAPHWQTYSGRARCDACIRAMYRAPGTASPTQPARWRRVQGRDVRLFCYPHAQQYRQRDDDTERAP